jgi:hypothetical protein
METFLPRLTPMSLGSVPHVNPAEAWGMILRHFPDIPTWPQLPRRSFLENMYVQVSAGFPGLTLKDDRIFVDRRQSLDASLERLYIQYLANDLEPFDISPDYAAGLHAAAGALTNAAPRAIKGQITGPISWGLMVVDQDRRPILYDDILADALARHLRMKAEWQERYLRRLAPQTIIFLDEPYLSAFGSAFVAVGRELVLELLDETLAGLQGLKGAHCCGNTDWGLLLSTSINVLSLDAYQFAHTLALYPDELAAFMERGGLIAWGLVPNTVEAHKETPASLLDRFEAALSALEAKGLSRQRLLDSAFITPACGTGALEPALAEHIFHLTSELSQLARQRYLGISRPADGRENN